MEEPDIVDILAKFGIKTEVLGITHGVTYTLFELEFDEGIKVARVWKYEDELAAALSVESLRIVPIPGRNAVGIEVPNRERTRVDFESFTDALESSKEVRIPVVLGKDVNGRPVILDLASCANILVAGNPGTGKTMLFDSFICSILRTRLPEETSLAIIDTKGVEFSIYNGDSHLLSPVITEVSGAFDFLENLIPEIERRIKLFNEAGVRSIEDYNCRISESPDSSQKKLPYIVVLVDEFSHLMMENGKRFETLINRITATARFCGIHLVVSTSRCSTSVITAEIKNDFPSRIAFAVSNCLGSRIILDQVGAEKLLGAGDLLFCMNVWKNHIRVQAPLVDVTKELKAKL